MSSTNDVDAPLFTPDPIVKYGSVGTSSRTCASDNASTMAAHVSDGSSGRGIRHSTSSSQNSSGRGSSSETNKCDSDASGRGVPNLQGSSSGRGSSPNPHAQQQEKTLESSKPTSSKNPSSSTTSDKGSDKKSDKKQESRHRSSSSHDWKKEMESFLDKKLDCRLDDLQNTLLKKLTAAIVPVMDSGRGAVVSASNREADAISIMAGEFDDNSEDSPSPKRHWKDLSQGTGRDKSPPFLPPGISRIAKSAAAGAPSEVDQSTHSGDDTRSVCGRDSADDVDLVPHSWPATMEVVAKTLDIQVEKPVVTAKASILTGAFSGLVPQPEPQTPALPADGLLDNKWDKINKSLPRVSFSEENRMRKQYRWPESDFDRRGKCPNLDKSVSTYLNTRLGGTAKFKPRTLYPTETKAEKALESVDRVIRCQQRVVSHSSYLLAALRRALSPDSDTSEEDVASILGALATATCDMAALSTTALARCTHERRLIYLDALNLPDKSDRDTLLKVPMEGPELFGGKFNEVAKEASQLRRDAREMASTLSSTAGGSTQSGNAKRKADSMQPPGGQFKRFKNLAPHEERCLPPPGDKRWVPSHDTSDKKDQYQQKPRTGTQSYNYNSNQSYSNSNRGGKAPRGQKRPFRGNKNQ